MAKESSPWSSPFLIYFAGIGTVVAALGVGFGGGLFPTGTYPVKEGPRAKDRPEIVAKQDKPELPIATTPVTVRTPEENKAGGRAPGTRPKRSTSRKKARGTRAGQAGIGRRDR